MNLANHITTKDPIGAKKTNGQLNRNCDGTFMAECFEGDSRK